MKPQAKFNLVGNIAKINAKDNVTFIDIASYYGRKSAGSDEWQDDTHWNTVTAFRNNIAAVEKLNVGDFVEVEGRLRKNSYERDGHTHYTVELIVSSIKVVEREPKKQKEAA